MAFFQSAAAAKPHFHAEGDRCPTCDQPIPNDRLDDVNRRIAERERQVTADAEAKTRIEVEAVRVQGLSALEALKVEVSQREKAARDEGQRRATEVFQGQLTDATEAKAAAERKAAELEASRDAAIAARTAELRDALERDKATALGVEQAKHFDEMQKAHKLVDDLKRKLENKTAEELGEGAEVDLFEALKAEFPTDMITRVGRGNAGADVIHEIRHNGAVCGKIVYDSKNHGAWRTEHATKLREDQIAAKADHAVLSTRAFPKDRKQLHIEHGVIIANPARAVVVAMLLRQQIVQLHVLKVSNTQRASKTEELYTLMTSDRFGQFLASVTRAAEQLEALQTQEKKAHEAMWRRQGELFRTVIRSVAHFDDDVARIIGTAAPLEVPSDASGNAPQDAS